VSLKKNLQSLIESRLDAELFFFDESRFGTHSKVGHGWFKKGSRTPVRIKLGFQNFYVYSSINPTTGEDFTLMMPSVDTVCFNIYLEEFSKLLSDRKIIMVVDGAGWHKSKDLVMPANITLVFLPPYSPELNPVERFWKFIKYNTIRNQIFDTLADLEQALCIFFKTITPSIVTSICHVDYI
jgi:hypothetical protein